MSTVWPERVPDTREALADMLRVLRLDRRERKKALGRRPPRGGLSAADREAILKKTGERCHICGGVVDGTWQADHVLAHSGGGGGKAENYLPAHRLCNNYRWDYSPEEMQAILKIGVWARTQIEKETRVGKLMGETYLRHERKRASRRKDHKHK